MYPHGNILQYEIVAVENSSGVMSHPLSISNGTLEFPISMMITGVGIYLVKVCNFHIVNVTSACAVLFICRRIVIATLKAQFSSD